MTHLAFSPDLPLPRNAATQKVAFLGTSGGGKTYAAGKFAECLLEAGVQVVILDTIGNWYGLRLNRSSGKPGGFSIPILGGEYGDVPLEPTAGRLVADLIADTRSSMILDISDFTGRETVRFVHEFATHLLKRKKKAKSPVMMIWEECQDIVPQHVTGDVAVMVGAVEKLIKKGRNYGVGTALISQQPQAVNKAVLNQAETLFVFRTGGKHERKAIEDWIVDKHIDVGDLVDELPAMATGTCYVWSPYWLKVLKKIKVGAKKTFDATATPEFDDEVKAAELAPIDLKKFEKTMAETIQKARESDPADIRRRLAEAQAELARLKNARPVVETKVERVEIPVFKDGEVKRLETTVKVIATAAGDLVTAGNQFTAVSREISAALRAAANRPAPTITRMVTPARPISQPAAEAADSSLPRGQQRILDALAWLESVRVPQARKTQVALLAGQSPTSSGYTNNLGALRSAGLIHYPAGGHVALTQAGGQRAQAPERPLTTAELHQALYARLTRKQGLILQALIAAYPQPLSKDELAGHAEQSPTSSAYGNHLGALRSLGFLDYPATGQVVALPVLFLD